MVRSAHHDKRIGTFWTPSTTAGPGPSSTTPPLQYSTTPPLLPFDTCLFSCYIHTLSMSNRLAKNVRTSKQTLTPAHRILRPHSSSWGSGNSHRLRRIGNRHLRLPLD